MGRTRILSLLVLLLGALLSTGHSCYYNDDDDDYYDDCYWVDDEWICDDDYDVGAFRPLPRAETGVLLKGAADPRFSRVSITIKRIELLGEKTEVIYDDPHGLVVDLCAGGSQNNVYDRVLAKASVAPGTCTAVRMTYDTATCVPTSGPRQGQDVGAAHIEQATDGEVLINLDAAVPMGPGERRFFVVQFDLAATLVPATGAPSGVSTATPENDPRAANGNWIMWPRGEAHLYRPTQALMQ